MTDSTSTSFDDTEKTLREEIRSLIFDSRFADCESDPDALSVRILSMFLHRLQALPRFDPVGVYNEVAGEMTVLHESTSGEALKREQVLRILGVA